MAAFSCSITSCLLSPQSRRSVELGGDTSKGYSERLVRDVMSIDVHVGAVCVKYVSNFRE